MQSRQGICLEKLRISFRITAEVVHRVLVALAADEIRIAETEPRPLTIAKLNDHAGSQAFCRSLAREAANDTAVVEATNKVQAFIRTPRGKR